MGLVIAIHIIICTLLIIIILIQAGRGGGLVESFSGVESMFGPRTSAFLTRATTILSTLFFITCVGLAFLSARQSKSLMQNIKIPIQQNTAPIKAEPQAEQKNPTVTEPIQQKTDAQQDSKTQSTPVTK